MAESTYRSLIAWQRAIDLVVVTYEFSEQFPRHEVFALRPQVRRAAISVPSNIAEGRGRGTARDFRRFLLQARGSLFELETQAEIAYRLRYVTERERDEIVERIGSVIRVVNGLVRKLSATIKPARRSLPAAR